jgi:hypothetical protein
MSLVNALLFLILNSLKIYKIANSMADYLKLCHKYFLPHFSLPVLHYIILATESVVP